jgi:disulfide bond formation protein DsbB
MQLIKAALTSRWYWIGLALLGVGMLGVALYYQYGVGDEPCQICIHSRIWVAALTLVALVMACLPNTRLLGVVGNLLLLLCAICLGERAWLLYEIENGRGDASCEFYLGFPSWFALDTWLPAVFEVRNLCSYTPEMAWGLSMAESLLVAAAGLVVIAVASLLWRLNGERSPVTA